MRFRPVTVLVLVQVVFALALVSVAWSGQHGRAQLRADNRALSRQLAVTQAQLVEARAAADSAERRANAAAARATALQAQVDALELALRRAGGDPDQVITTRPTSSSNPRPRTRVSSSPRPRPTPSRTPAASPTPRPTPSPSPTCRPLPIIGCRR